MSDSCTHPGCEWHIRHYFSRFYHPDWDTSHFKPPPNALICKIHISFSFLLSRLSAINLDLIWICKENGFWVAVWTNPKSSPVKRATVRWRIDIALQQERCSKSLDRNAYLNRSLICCRQNKSLWRDWSIWFWLIGPTLVKDLIMSVTGLLPGLHCDLGIEKVGSVWRKRPCSLTDLALTLSKIYDSRWCAVLIKIDYIALLVLCPSVMALLSRIHVHSFSAVLTAFRVFLSSLFYSCFIWCFTPPFVSQSAMHLIMIVKILSFIGVMQCAWHAHPRTITDRQAQEFLSMTLLKGVIIIAGKS